MPGRFHYCHYLTLLPLPPRIARGCGATGTRREERRMYRIWFGEIHCDGRVAVYAHKYPPSSVLDILLVYASGVVQVVPSQLPAFPQNYM